MYWQSAKIPASAVGRVLIEAGVLELVVGGSGVGNEAVIFFQLLARHAHLFKIHVGVDRLVVFPAGLSVPFDHRKDWIGFACLRGRQCECGNGAAGCNG